LGIYLHFISSLFHVRLQLYLKANESGNKNSKRFLIFGLLPKRPVHAEK
jgi:hypothetical protein